MSPLTVASYAHSILGHIPWEHWVGMVVVALAWTIILLIRKKYSVYGAIAWGLTVFMALFLLDTAVVIRYLGLMKHSAGHNLTLDFSRMFQKTGLGQAESICNVAVFVPFGLFLSEFLASAMQLRPGRQLGLATLAVFGLSLCIESLQLVLKVGFFELTDLVMNTVGAFVGAEMAVVGRMVLGRDLA